MQAIVSTSPGTERLPARDDALGRMPERCVEIHRPLPEEISHVEQREEVSCPAEEEFILAVRRSGIGPAQERAEMRFLLAATPRQVLLPISAVSSKEASALTPAWLTLTDDRHQSRTPPKQVAATARRAEKKRA